MGFEGWDGMVEGRVFGALSRCILMLILWAMGREEVVSRVVR